MSAFVEAVLALFILGNVMVLGLGVEVARKMGKRSQLLRAAFRFFRHRCPHTGAAIWHFTSIWDAFAHSPDVAFEERFAVFCDQLGDMLEAAVTRAVDALELWLSPDPKTAAGQLAHLPRRRLTAADVSAGVGSLRVTTCPICLSDFQKYEDIRLLTSCQHCFHTKCVDGWLCRVDACPMCRLPVLVSNSS